MVPAERTTHGSRHHIVVHYGELGLKGRNRPVFLHALMQNLERTLSSLGEGSVEQQSGRLLLTAPESVPWAQLEERLQQVFGVANFSRCWTAPHDLEAVKQAASAQGTAVGSQEISRILGTHVLATHATGGCLINERHFFRQQHGCGQLE